LECGTNPETLRPYQLLHRGRTARQVRDGCYPGAKMEPNGDHGIRSTVVGQDFCDGWLITDKGVYPDGRDWTRTSILTEIRSTTCALKGEA
jgi:hypothetical protein